MKDKIRKIILGTDTPAGRNFDLFIQGLIILSLITFPLETIQNLPDYMMQALIWIEIITVAIFTCEYVLRLWVKEKKLKFIFSFFGLIDLLAILPFYLNTAVDLRILRVFRLFRIFRLFELPQYSEALDTFNQAFKSIKSELFIFGGFSLMILYISSIGIYTFEHDAQPEVFGSVFDALWWSIVTLTTVGYGDAYPITIGGKIFTSLIIIIGIGIVAVPTGLLATAMRESRSKLNK
tara:strand:+ start:138 stop:845 length:708 start_codon:yes stop_codon:yes gene_type:complete